MTKKVHEKKFVTSNTKGHPMPPHFEQQTVAFEKALVAFGVSDTAQVAFLEADVAAKNAKDAARKAKIDSKMADAAYFKAVKDTLAAVKAATKNTTEPIAKKVSVTKKTKKAVGQTPPESLPNKNDINSRECDSCMSFDRDCEMYGCPDYDERQSTQQAK